MLEYQYLPTKADINEAGHIDNCSIYTWFNLQRSALFNELGFESLPYLVSTTLNFTNELFEDVPIVIESSVKKVGNSSLTIRQQIKQQGRVCVECESVSVSVNSETNQKQPIPHHIKLKIAQS